MVAATRFGGQGGPDGWTNTADVYAPMLNGTGFPGVFWRVVDGTEGDSVAIAGLGLFAVATVMEFSRANLTTPFPDSFAYNLGGNDTSIPIGSLDVSTPNSLLLDVFVIVGDIGSGTTLITADPAGDATRVDYIDYFNPGMELAVASQVVGAGTVPDSAWTWNHLAGINCRGALRLAIAPA
jgi:hypothetical protein